MNSEPRLLTPFQTASQLVRSFYEIGLRHVIISPGSRSTPLTLAFSYHSGFNKKVILDERSAAFTALGIGKESGKPAILVCTSGTAAANYHPAIAEALESGVPLIVCTADRPPSLRGIGSSQTLDQIKIFGDSAVWFHEMGEPADSEEDRQRIKYAARQAMEESIRTGGASHLNIPFRKPLEPNQSLIESEKKGFDEQIESLKYSSDPSQAYTSTISFSQDVSKLINQSKRPLIIAGPSDPFRQQSDSILKLSSHLNAPVIAEPGSGIQQTPHQIKRFELIIRNNKALKRLRPDLIIRFGDQPFSKSLLTAIHQYRDVPLIRFDARNAWQDHEMNTLHRIRLESNDRIELSEIHHKKNTGYLESWKEPEQVAESTLSKALNTTATLCDGHVFSHVASNLPDHWNVMLSNSLPVRDAALFGSPEGQLFLNRGAAGIDGILSTALGTAVSSGSPTCCMIGDLAFLHDSNALLSIRHISTPFVIVVINNNGGNIFRMLPIHEHDDVYTDYFETPQKAKLEHLALAHSMEYRQINTLDELIKLTFDGLEADVKPVVVECITNPENSMNLRRKLWGA